MMEMELDPVPDPDVGLKELQQHVLKLLNTHLSDESILLKRTTLRLFHQSSFYLQLDLNGPSRPSLTQLQGPLETARSHVFLLLFLLDMLMEEIVQSCQQLKSFLLQSEQGPVDQQLFTDTLSTVKEVHKNLTDFNTRPIRNLGPLDLSPHPVPNSGLLRLLPVYFDSLQSYPTSTTVRLAWTLASGLPEDPHPVFEVESKILHPTVGQQDLSAKSVIIQTMCCTLRNLTPDRCYQFSVKRLHRYNLVYSEFTDTIIIKTLPE